MIRIAVIIHDFELGGAERIALRLSRYWHAHGAQVVIIAGASEGPQRDLLPDDMPVIAPDRPIHRGFTRKALTRHVAASLQSWQPDIVFLPGNYYFGLAFGLRKVSRGARFVGKISNAMARSGENVVSAWIRTRLLRLKSRFLDKIVLFDESMIKEVRSYLGGGGSRYAVSGHPVLDQLPVLQERLDRQDARLMCAGRLVEQKDFKLAIDTLPHLPEHIGIDIFGSGHLLDELQAHVAHKGLQGRVCFRGHKADLAQAYAQADLFLLTSRYEGFPTVVVEALSHGVPVVATDCALPLGPLLSDPALGTLVEERSAERIATIVRERLAAPSPDREHLRARTAAYLLPNVAERFLAIFKETLDR